MIPTPKRELKSEDYGVFAEMLERYSTILKESAEVLGEMSRTDSATPEAMENLMTDIIVSLEEAVSVSQRNARNVCMCEACTCDREDFFMNLSIALDKRR